VTETNGTIETVSAQDLLNLASQKLLEIAEPPEFFTGEVSLSGGVYYLQVPNGKVFGYYNFSWTRWMGTRGPVVRLR
jgi:hypothetical protein